MEFVPREVLESARKAKGFKVHLVLGVGTCIAAFVVWGFVGTFLSQWPWFVYAFGAVVISLSFHYYVVVRRPRLPLNFHVALFGSVNAMLFLTWLCTRTLTSSAWFLYTLFGTAVPLGVHMTLSRYANSPHRWLYVHYTAAVLVNVICFFVWMDTGKGFPWFIYTVTGTALLVIIHHAIDTRASLFSLHLRLFLDANVTLFFSWVVAGMSFPWWVFVMALWAFLLFLHHRYDIWRAKRNAAAESQRKNSAAEESTDAAAPGSTTTTSSSSSAARGMTRRDFIITIDDSMLRGVTDEGSASTPSGAAAVATTSSFPAPASAVAQPTEEDEESKEEDDDEDEDDESSAEKGAPRDKSPQVSRTTTEDAAVLSFPETASAQQDAPPPTQ